ncbi:replicative DNA helicase [Treponema brennaborense]|uniref:Replicative DNA helicase n=1 Tax=Treponema brennaborense (strain DSM 12168 / CIP 105900 / DD5/3) TaxID=906968 RepID=F4LN87_TREBD|nr:replicative DNA helicase [Treponema brennaborense]AEE16852.1 replicative DNA helicase [Treponema brennaborense DSM 12168]
MPAASLKDKIPPHNLEAEQATLGALLLDWGAVSTVISFLRPDRFYSLQNQVIFTAMLSLFNKGQHGDLLTLTEELRSTGQLDAAGGTAYISSLTDTVPTSANVEYYAKIVLDQSIRRELIKISSQITAESHDETKESRAVLEEAQNKIFSLTDLNQAQDIKSMVDLVPKTIEMIEMHYKNRDAYTGVPSGLTELDSMTSGFQKSELIIIGARPSMGKTAMALSMAQYISIEKKIPTGFFSLEMSYQQIGQRLLSQEARIPAQKLRTGMLKLDDFQKLQEAAGRCYEAPFYIVDSPNMKLLDLRAMARRMRTVHHVEIIFIDYITLITSENTTIPRHEQIAEISRSLKSLARELDIPVVALSQVRRDSEGKEPTLADLRESGSIEQDADVVMFIHRDRKQAESLEAGAALETRLVLAKQRNGPIGSVDIMFIPSYTKFENRAE